MPTSLTRGFAIMALIALTGIRRTLAQNEGVNASLPDDDIPSMEAGLAEPSMEAGLSDVENPSMEAGGSDEGEAGVDSDGIGNELDDVDDEILDAEQSATESFTWNDHCFRGTSCNGAFLTWCGCEECTLISDAPCDAGVTDGDGGEATEAPEGSKTALRLRHHQLAAMIHFAMGTVWR